MKTKKTLPFILALAALCGSMAIFQNCSPNTREKAEEMTGTAGETHAGQTEINAIVTLIDNYTRSIGQAFTQEELMEMDTQFAENLSRYADSTQPVTEADRTAVLNASAKLGRAAYDKLASFGQAPDIDLAAQQQQMAELLSRCTTVGQLVQAGL